MTSIFNPQIQVKVFTEFGDFEFLEEDMDVEIEKDLDEEPNKASAVLHNLNSDNREAMVNAGLETAQIEIYLTPLNSADLVRAFSGNIVTAQNHNMHPGFETRLHCEGDKENHRSFFVKEKTFAAGTSIASVINWLVDQVGLPRKVATLPSGNIEYSYSMSGIAFPLLKQYVSDYALYAYILDGVLHVSGAGIGGYSLETITPLELDSNLLFEPPRVTSRTDSEQLEIKTIRINKQATNNRKRKKIKVKGPSEFVSRDAVDKYVSSREYNMFCQPGIEPDMVMSILEETTRVQSIEHSCSNYAGGDWESVINADLSLDIA